ncbi:leucine-rich repeat serine/threonine-protein kinase 1 isoform X2 [Planococcus citri]|uniref:leucine-rich repeat serine/threonine-protein kinase 1 isoform X2 n=1 Tax=Planococcus citri TaxID=170843 RepID=UPI0031F87B98
MIKRIFRLASAPREECIELGYDVCNYFVDNYYDDAWEQSRHTAHVALRDAVLIGDVQLLKSLIAELGDEAEPIINMAPNGSNTLLFVACEMGNKDIVKLLIDNDADGRIHPVTRYSPLYISCFKGWIDVVDILLKKFPELVQQCTVEKWLPIHAACINGHMNVMEILLKYQYPKQMYCKYRIGDWEYELPFDVNMKDVTGQNVLYIASLLGNYKMVDAILKYKVRAIRIKSCENENETDDTNKNVELPSPTRRRISDGIQSIMSRLNLGLNNASNTNDINERFVSPWNVDDYCNHHSETALHAAVRQKHVEIVSLLLLAGANPNLSIYSVDNGCAAESSRQNAGSRSSSSTRNQTTTALVVACENRDVSMVELLLKNEARDDEAKALFVAIQNGDDILITKLLSIKAYTDPEHKINKKAMNEKMHANFGALTNFTYSNMFAYTPVMINWHNAYQCQLPRIKPQWLVDAALHINPKLKLNPKSQQIVLYAITRLDVSNNALTSIPPVIFQLQSLRYLNLAQNKIKKLPTSQDFEEECSPSNKRRSRVTFTREKGYSAPFLEELYLQDNRLEEIPEEVFRLPLLVTLDVSNNKLQELPFQLWRAPKLKELNAAFNLLRELPAPSIEEISASRKSICSIDSGHSTDSASDALTNAMSENSCKWKSVQLLELQHHNEWSETVEISEQILHVEEHENSANCSQLSSLNLAHNQFTAIPVVLSCLAVNLTRLNMAYNSLRTMSYITSYPSSLKQLDLSHNKICVWPSLPQVHDDNLDPTEQAFISCYHQESGFKMTVNKLLSGRRQTLRSSVLNSVCTHRRHLRLENLRTLVLADNSITRIQFSTDDDGLYSNLHDSRDDLDDWEGINASSALTNNPTSVKTRLMFPNVSMLDLSNNHLREIPSNIHELGNLSVLNISGNIDITELPPQMGLLSRLWNLNTRGCNLQEPLRSMIDSNKYKTMDVVGYLKSILEDARPYARMKLMIVGVQGIGKTSLLDQLRQEGSGSYKKKPVEHWAKRMGNKNINVKTSKGTNMSTVGVDIADWVYEKKVRNHSSHGPVMFRTWDFGGQREYYATHQYFLSKRSLYLVVWRIPDGQKGILEIFHWLINIQARAPNSPVLIIGTHYDLMREQFPATRSEDLQQLIREKFVNIVDAEKCGLPRVLDTIEVSCKTRHNIKLLCNLIYDTVFSLRLPGSKELLLEQKVPASYLALEDVVSHVAAERRQRGHDPVLNVQEYKTVVSNEMMTKFQRSFRDWAELHQATLFLHENGVLLHYDDATLKELYFLDPQWLCDMLAHVVTIREINPFARTGIMKLDDLKHIFKSTNLNLTDAQEYIVNLLNKFEVALTWDNRTLLIPSLLPSEEETLSVRTTSVRIPLRSRNWAIRSKKASTSNLVTLSGSTFHHNSPGGSFDKDATSSNMLAEMTNRSDPEASIRRLLIMTYFPSGFWSRLITRILGDDSIIEIVRCFFIIPKEVMQDNQLLKLLDVKVEWVLWQTGMELRYADIVIFRVKEVLPNVRTSPINYKEQRIFIKQENVWCDIDLKNASLLEIFLPLDNIVIKRPVLQKDENIGYQAIVLDPSPEYSTQLLALTVDHIDVLLEDWYPTLGTRFVHTSEGKFLITRLVPCPRCISSSSEDGGSFQNDIDDCKNPSWQQCLSNKTSENQNTNAQEFDDRIRRIRKSQESCTSDGDSGVGGESPSSSCKTSVEGYPETKTHDDDDKKSGSYSWLIEECILASYNRKCVTCPTHGDISLAQVAPDTLFLDLGEKCLIRPQHISRGKLLGRGAFGFVFKGTYKIRGTNDVINVAMKMLQPVQPGTNANPSALMAYKGAQNKWDRDPLQYACKAYCTARQELNILLNLQHINIVPLIGVCTKPLALVLDLAPCGALDQTLKNYRRSGARFDAFTLQAIILQAAKALEYLHQQHIIYRDLKSENVLVWCIPPPFYHSEELPKVHIKLADYGISRLTLPSGTKGFGGTEGFMAPEIMKYNGEEEYTEKVDCFSFGMFIYELLTLHQPFENHESVKECILEGGRPSLTRKETLYPSYMLDLMVICWAQSPSERPSASQIVSIASAPEFTHLYDVVSLDHSSPIITSLAVPLSSTVANAGEYTNENKYGGEVWLGCSNLRADQLLNNDKNWLQYSSLNLPECPTAMAVVDEKYVWIGDVRGQIHAYSVIDCSHIFSYALSLDTNDIGSVCKLAYLPHLNRVAVALTNGRIFLVRSDTLPSTSTMAEGSFVMTELGSTTILYTLTVLYKADETGKPNSVCELWCGESNGTISIFTMHENSVVGHDIINHFETPLPNVEVLQLVSSHSPILYHSRHPAVWSYIYPGCVVYEWEPQSRTILNKLDCSKLAPCSESIKSISIEEHLSPGRCQVTSICVMENEIYIGTTWGCIVVAERESMRPITVFRPFQEEVCSILALPVKVDGRTCLATVGRGYRSLINRYKPGNVSSKASLLINSSTFAILWSTGYWAAT